MEARGDSLGLESLFRLALNFLLTQLESSSPFQLHTVQLLRSTLHILLAQSFDLLPSSGYLHSGIFPSRFSTR